MNNMWKNFKGYVIISISGFNKERFLNLCRKNGIYIWNVRYLKTAVEFYIFTSDCRLLESVSKKTGTEFNIKKEYGLPVYISRYKKRFMFVAGMLFFILSVNYASSLVWYIEIIGNNSITDKEILSVCKDNNLFYGSYTKNTDYGLVAENLKKSFDNISWINITVKGTKAVIKLAESEEKSVEVPNEEPCDIVSDKNCVISDIVTLKGMPLVKSGDSVLSGDVLVSGTLLPVGFEENREPAYTHSKADIRGVFCETKLFKIPMQVSEKKYTGNESVTYYIKFFEKVFTVGTEKKTKFKMYDTFEDVTQLKFDLEHTLPVFVVRHKSKEYSLVKRTLTEKEASTKAEAELTAYILSYPTDADIVSTKLNCKKEKDYYILTAEITTEQNIGINQNISPPQEEQNFNGTGKNADSQ